MIVLRRSWFEERRRFFDDVLGYIEVRGHAHEIATLLTEHTNLIQATSN